jgi:hypothetical protein
LRLKKRAAAIREREVEEEEEDDDDLGNMVGILIELSGGDVNDLCLKERERL